MFRRRFWLSLLLSLPVVATSDMVMDWFGYELDFAGIEWVGPVLGIGHLRMGRVAVPAGGWREAKGASARDDAADRHGDHRRLHRVDGHLARLVRPGLLVGAVAPGDDHAARPLAGDEGARPGPGRARGPRRPPARRGRAHRTRRSARDGDVGGPATGRRGAGPGRRTGPGRRGDRRGDGRARRVDDHRGVEAGHQGWSATGWSAGTVSTDSSIRVRVDAVGEDTALAGIQRLVAQAQQSTVARAGPRRSRRGAPLLRGHGGCRRDRRGLARRSATPTRRSCGS